MTTPSPELAARVRQLAQAKETQLRRRQLRVGVASVAAIAGIGLAGSVLFPRPALATRLQHAAALLENRAVYLRVEWLQQGKVTLTQELWSDGTRFRQDSVSQGEQLSQVTVGDRCYFLRRGPKPSVVWQEEPPQDVAAPLRRSLATFRHALTQLRKDARSVRDEGLVFDEGRQLRRVVLQGLPADWTRHTSDPATSQRAIVLLDPQTDQPSAVTLEENRAGQWQAWMRSRFSFPDALPEATFATTLPGITPLSLEALGADAGRRFTKPLAVGKRGPYTITIRDVELNRDGDLTILYTDGATPRQSKGSSLGFDHLTTDTSITYTGTAGAVETFVFMADKKPGRGFTVDGQPVQAWHFVPLTPHPKRLPTRLRITLNVELYRGNLSYWRPITLAVSVPPPSKALVPRYARELRLLELTGYDESRYRQDVAAGRSAALYNREDWKGMLALADQELAAGRASNHVYLDRFRALLELRRFDEAERALDQAQQDDFLGIGAATYTQAWAELAKARRAAAARR